MISYLPQSHSAECEKRHEDQAVYERRCKRAQVRGYRRRKRQALRVSKF